MPAEQDLTLNDLSLLAEHCDLECKAAQGRDGFLGSEGIRTPASIRAVCMNIYTP
jgi:hypothetical protein